MGKMMSKIKRPVYQIIRNLINRLPRSVRLRLYRTLVKVSPQIPEGLHFKIAETKEELESAFRMLHDAYFEGGLLGSPLPSGMRVTRYHALPSTTTLVGKIGEEVIATLSILRDNPMGLPSDALTDLSHLRRGGRRVAEISALAIKKQYRGQAFLYLLKFMYENCVNILGVNHLVANIILKPQVYELYEAVLFFKKIEHPPLVHPELNSVPLQILHLDLDLAYNNFEQAYSGRSKNKDLFRFFTKDKLSLNHFPERIFGNINYPVMNPENFHYFFVEKTKTLESMQRKHLEILAGEFDGLPQQQMINNLLFDGTVLAFSRQSRNYRFEVVINCRARAKGKDWGSAKIMDVSKKGLRLYFEHGEAAQIEIEFDDGQGQRRYVSGTVAWRDNRKSVLGLSIEAKDESWDRVLSLFEEKRLRALSGLSVPAPSKITKAS